jgi:hypothetical protein
MCLTSWRASAGRSVTAHQASSDEPGPARLPGPGRYRRHRVVRRTKTAAGDRNVMLRGNPAQECLRAGLLDEIEIRVIPVVIGERRRLFDDLGQDHIELELVRALEAPGVMHLRYRVHSAD